MTHELRVFEKKKNGSAELINLWKLFVQKAMTFHES